MLEFAGSVLAGLLSELLAWLVIEAMEKRRMRNQSKGKHMRR